MRFATKSCLRQHTECVHLKVRYSCNRCEKDFSQHTGLRRHISEIHEKTDHYQCKQCERNYTRKEALQKHVESIHRN